MSQNGAEISAMAQTENHVVQEETVYYTDEESEAQSALSAEEESEALSDFSAVDSDAEAAKYFDDYAPVSRRVKRKAIYLGPPTSPPPLP